MSADSTLNASLAWKSECISRKLKRLLGREDLRRNPVRGVCRRVAWRIRWRMFSEPWFVRPDAEYSLLLPHSGAGALIYFQGSSDPELAYFIRRFLKPGMVFVDVGAHLGEYTILAATLLKGFGCVHAFEAGPETFEILECNVELNGYPNVFTRPWAVWKEDGLIEFETLQDSSTSALRPERTTLEGGRLVKVHTVALDSYFKDFGPPIPSLIKIDVEGAELQVLQGASTILSSPQAPTLIVEYGPRNTARLGYSADNVCRYLRDKGYDLYQWNGLDHLTWVKDRPALAPTQDSCNLVAIKSDSNGNRPHFEPGLALVKAAV